MKLKKIKNVFVLSIVTFMLAGNSVMAASTSTSWTEAPTKYYDSAKTYSNAFHDGYSFTINKIAKKGNTEDNKSYTKLNMWLTATNPNMRLEYQTTFQAKNQWTFVADKNKKYSYNLIDSNGVVGGTTGLNVLIKSYESSNVNANITHTIN